MAFNLKKVLRALLFSSSQPLSIKDVQDTFARFHETKAPSVPSSDEGRVTSDENKAAEASVAPNESLAASATPAAPEPVEIFAEAPDDPELYQDVPSLVTGTQIREVMDEISTELRAADSDLVLIEGASGYRLVTQPRFARWVRILRAEAPPLKLSPSSLETLAVVAYRQPVTRVEIEAIRGVSAEAGINRLIERELICITGRADQPGRPLQYGTTDQFLEFAGLKSLDELPASDVLTTRQLDDWLQTAMNPTKLGDAEMGLPQEQLSLEASPTGNTGGSPAVETPRPGDSAQST